MKELLELCGYTEREIEYYLENHYHPSGDCVGEWMESIYNGGSIQLEEK